MQTKFKRHQKVKLLRDPLEKNTEPYSDENLVIKKGMTGEVNIILPNGQYHVAIKNSKGEKLAYVVMDEEALEAVESAPHLDHQDIDDVDEVLTDIHQHHGNKNNN